MNRRALFTVAGLAVVAGSLALAQPDKDSTAAGGAAVSGGQPQFTEQQMKDMQTCMEAGTPGENHAWLAEAVGTWTGKTTMWMAPGAPPMESECTNTTTAVMDGRFIRCEIVGDMGGMPFTGLGLYGFDNVAQEFQSTWIDNCGSGIMVGKGSLSSDRKTLTWNFNYNCPITKKQAVMREVETRTGKDAFTLQMFGKEPHTGVEYKMMEIAFTRKPGAGAAAGAAGAASVSGAGGGR